MARHLARHARRPEVQLAAAAAGSTATTARSSGPAASTTPACSPATTPSSAPSSDPEYQPPAGEPYYYTNALSDQAARFITEHHQQHADQPFFFYVAYTAAHWPMHALERDVAKYKGKYDVGYEPIRKARFEREKQMGLIDPKLGPEPAGGRMGEGEE